MVSFNWYAEVPHTEKVAQGDIFLEFPVPLVRYDSSKYPFFKPGWTKKDVIVMTQACDIEQNKVNELTFCPLVPVENIAMDLLHIDAKQSRDNQWKNGKRDEGPIVLNFKDAKIEKKARSKINDLRKGEYTVMHLLNEHISQTGISMGTKVVLLKDTYQVPLAACLDIIGNPALYPSRLRLLPPYREHLAQAFANVYSRIGLPQDIKPNGINLSFPNNKSYSYEPPISEE